MELRFVAPELREIDLIGSEVLACAVFSDQRPPRGVAGLVDWRMAARLSRYLESQELTGVLGEVALIPGKPRIPFEKVLVFGAGTTEAFDEESYSRVMSQMLDTLAGLGVRIAVVERPGRHLGRLDLYHATDLLLCACEERHHQDRWTLVEEAEDQKLIAQHIAEQKRKKRMR